MNLRDNYLHLLRRKLLTVRRTLSQHNIIYSGNSEIRVGSLVFTTSQNKIYKQDLENTGYILKFTRIASTSCWMIRAFT